jgi:hypothetical protein
MVLKGFEGRSGVILPQKPGLWQTG